MATHPTQIDWTSPEALRARRTVEIESLSRSLAYIAGALEQKAQRLREVADRLEGQEDVGEIFHLVSDRVGSTLNSSNWAHSVETALRSAHAITGFNMRLAAQQES